MCGSIPFSLKCLKLTHIKKQIKVIYKAKNSSVATLFMFTTKGKWTQHTSVQCTQNLQHSKSVFGKLHCQNWRSHSSLSPPEMSSTSKYFKLKASEASIKIYLHKHTLKVVDTHFKLERANYLFLFNLQFSFLLFSRQLLGSKCFDASLQISFRILQSGRIQHFSIFTQLISSFDEKQLKFDGVFEHLGVSTTFVSNVLKHFEHVFLEAVETFVFSLLNNHYK